MMNAGQAMKERMQRELCPHRGISRRVSRDSKKITKNQNSSYVNTREPSAGPRPEGKGPDGGKPHDGTPSEQTKKGLPGAKSSTGRPNM